MKEFLYFNNVGSHGKLVKVRQPVRGPIYFRCPWAVIYVDPQGTAQLERFPLAGAEELDQVQQVVRDKMVRFGWQRVRIINLNESHLTRS